MYSGYRQKKVAFLSVILCIVIIVFVKAIFTVKTSGLHLPFGQYKLDNCIYLSMLISSREAEQRNSVGAIMNIEKDSLHIIYPNKEIKLTDIIYVKEKMSEDIVDEFNRNGIFASNYHKKYIYSLYKGDIKQRYSIYALDGELWFVVSAYSKESPVMSSIYSIYELKRMIKNDK